MMTSKLAYVSHCCGGIMPIAVFLGDHTLQFNIIVTINNKQCFTYVLLKPITTKSQPTHHSEIPKKIIFIMKLCH